MKNKQKAKAVEIMKRMDIYKPYIEGFEKEDKVCFFLAFFKITFCLMLIYLIKNTFR